MDGLSVSPRLQGALLLHEKMSKNLMGENSYHRALDLSIGAEVPSPRATIPLQRLEELVSQEASGAYSPQRVISPTMKTVVRREHPLGPCYQEAETYTFLIHSMKFARLTKLDNDRLVLIATGCMDPSPIAERTCFILFSDDEGTTWTQPHEIHRGPERPEPINLGGKRLMILPSDDPGFMCFSDNGGYDWGDRIPFPTLPDGRVTPRHGTVLVEGEVLSGIFMAAESPDASGWEAGSLIRRSRDGGHTWTEGIWLPREWQVSEGSLARAKDGALVAALRTTQAPGMPTYCDHWRRITSARSLDEGLTWTDHQVHFDYGKVHAELLTLKNGDLLMTYAVRMGELEGEMYHGVEAVLSRDCGRTWDWDRRFVLYRWAMHQSVHSPVSVELADGRILTIFLYHYDAPWFKGSFNSAVLGITSVVIWSLQT